MKKWLFLLLISCFTAAQNTRWTDYFSYFNVKYISAEGQTLYCATENGLFTYNLTTGEVRKISKANGLHEVKITAFAQNTEKGVMLVGYEGGKLDVIDGSGIHLIIDIPIDQNFQGDKSINYIYTEGDYAVFSMNFGILLFDLNKLEFKETCYFQQGATYYPVRKAVIYNNLIFAGSTNGLYSHAIDGMIPNFSAWTSSASGNISQVAKNSAGLVYVSGVNIFKSADGISRQNIGSYSNIQDIVSCGENLLLVQQNNVMVLDSNLNITGSKSYTDNLNTAFLLNGTLYAGTRLQGLFDGANYVAPDGPFSNISYSINIAENQLWIAPGGRDVSFNAPSYLANGYYHFDGNRWKHITDSNLNGNRYVMQVVPNPSNLKETYVMSYSNGLIKMTDDVFTAQYNRNNTIPQWERLTGGVFDQNGNLIILQAFALDVPTGTNAINIKDPSDKFVHISLAQQTTENKSGTTRPVVDNGYIWIPYPRGDKGLTVYKYNNTPFTLSDDKMFLISHSDNPNSLPSNLALCVAIDHDGTAWIGTSNGLRILKNPYPALESGNYQTERIVITQNGLGEELLRSTGINCIAVDAANHKWIGTGNSGVFYISENGQQLLNRFTSDNSPLPDNQVTDIQIDNKGEVFFVTPKGVVSYRSDVTDTGDSFGDVLAYPNPVRPGYSGNITIKGLAQNAYVKITDVAGNLVFETRASGGVAVWNGRNFNGKSVASGVYLVLMTNSDGTKHAATKIAVIR